MNKLFDGQTTGIPIFCNGTCCGCGRAVAIEIDKVAGGYGFKGGAVHEIGNWQFMVKGDCCQGTSSTPDDVGKSGEIPAAASGTDVGFFSKLSTPQAG
jgi:hypothetical protein